MRTSPRKAKDAPRMSQASRSDEICDDLSSTVDNMEFSIAKPLTSPGTFPWPTASELMCLKHLN